MNTHAKVTFPWSPAPGFCPGTGADNIFYKEPKRTIVRCPSCNKRLLLAEVHSIGGELTGFELPPHKPKGDKRQPRLR